jgi:hypothetical protein
VGGWGGEGGVRGRDLYVYSVHYVHNNICHGTVMIRVQILMLRTTT